MQVVTWQQSAEDGETDRRTRSNGVDQSLQKKEEHNHMLLTGSKKRQQERGKADLMLRGTKKSKVELEKTTLQTSLLYQQGNPMVAMA